MPLEPLSLWVAGRLGFVCPLGSLSSGPLPGSLAQIDLRAPGLLTFVVFGRCMMSLYRSFILPFWEGIRSSLLAGDVSSA